MKDSRTQHSTSGKTIGRAVALAVAFGATVVLAACGSDSGGTTGPSGSNSPVGRYAITTVNGQALPVAMYNDPLYKYEVTSGSISLTGDGKYIVVTRFKQTVPNDVSLITDSTFGTWSQTGTQIDFRNAEDTTAKDKATWAGANLTFALTDGKATWTYVYTKQ